MEEELSLEQLCQCMPNLDKNKATKYLPYLVDAMKEFGIDTAQRAACFLGQIAHESGELRYFVELADGKAYEGRLDLGNNQPGDGPRFKGRGVIQITGRSNYSKLSKALGVDLVSNPKRAADLDVAFRSAGWYWKIHNLNQYADEDNFLKITKIINGGPIGLADRIKYYKLAKIALGLE